MRSVDESRQRWLKTTEGATTAGGLQSLVNPEVNICESGLRSVCWKVFLLFQSVDLNKWAAVTEDSRIAYSALKSHFLRFIERPGDLDSAIDPLNDDDNSPWNTLRRDEQLCTEIVQDVERCMPDEPFFRIPETQKMLLQILFIYCKINQDIGYRQGMHELAAPILWVVQRDALASTAPKGAMSTNDGDRLMFDTLDTSFIEHDSFTLFNLIMRAAKSFYELGEPDGRLNSTLMPHGSSPIVRRSKHIHEVLLAQVDPELASHLTQIEILPQIFLIRWIRLVFGREFPFDALLALWDKLFAKDPDLELIDMICISMLLRIRWQLVDADYSVALTLLLKYPYPTPPHGPQTFIEDAIYLRDNLNMSSGSKLISHYSGRAPDLLLSQVRPNALAGRVNTNRVENKIAGRKSPLSSPTWLLPEQRGVEGLFQGAAKGVFDRGERLGINQVVRDAVDEVKKNMQGLSAGPSGLSRRASSKNTLSADESLAIPVVKTPLPDLEARNKKLALLLSDTIVEFQKEFCSTEVIPVNSVSVDHAIEKLRFIQLRLDDSSLPLQLDTSYTTIDTDSTRTMRQKANSQCGASCVTIPVSSGESIETTNRHVENTCPTTGLSPGLGGGESTRPGSTVTQPLEVLDAGLSEIGRPAAAIPTRSTLAQSSFAWMLGPDEHSTPSDKPPPAKSSAPFLLSGRRPGSGAARERSAFLFGDDPDENDVNAQVSPMSSENKDDFGLETMKRAGKG